MCESMEAGAHSFWFCSELPYAYFRSLSLPLSLVFCVFRPVKAAKIAITLHAAPLVLPVLILGLLLQYCFNMFS